MRKAVVWNPPIVRIKLEAALRRGVTIEQTRLHEVTAVDPWFLDQISQITEERMDQVADSANRASAAAGVAPPQASWFLRTGSWRLLCGVSRGAIGARGRLGGRREGNLQDRRHLRWGASEASTPYYYSTYEDEDEVRPSDGRQKILILLVPGPNRIGQGIEFDYCCVHAIVCAADAGFETIMLNCNPETVSTDYDTSDRLDFELLTFEDVMNVIEAGEDSTIRWA